MCEQLSVWSDAVPSEPGYYWFRCDSPGVYPLEVVAFLRPCGDWWIEGKPVVNPDGKFGPEVPPPMALAGQAAEMAELRADGASWKRQYELVLTQARKDNIRAEDADTYEQWLLDIGKLTGCGHVDERLPRCIEEEYRKLEEQVERLRQSTLTAELLEEVRRLLEMSRGFYSVHRHSASVVEINDALSKLPPAQQKEATT